MSVHPDGSDAIHWRLHLAAPPDQVFAMLATAEGRRRFWAESAEEIEGAIEYVFPDGLRWTGRIVESAAPRRFAVEYLGGARVVFECTTDGAAGTDLTLTETGTAPADRVQNLVGRVSVLLALKAAVDHGVDLRNHDRQRTWTEGYVEN